MADDLVQPQGEDGPVWDQFADDCLDWLFKHCGKDSAQYLAGCAFMSDRAAAYDALARKDAEIAELRKEVEALKFDGQILVKESDDREAWMQRAERAEARVSEAPVARVERWAGGTWVLHKCDLAGVYPPIVGKLIALVPLDEKKSDADNT